MIEKIPRNFQRSRKLAIKAKRRFIYNNPILYRNYLIKKHNFSRSYNAVADPIKLVLIDPESVIHSTNERFSWNMHEKWGCIRGGSWDQDVFQMEDSPKAKSLRERFEKGIEWHETKLYEDYTTDQMSHKDVISHLQRFDDLFESLQQRYKTSFELPDAKFMEEVCVCIARDGEILHSRSGRHRLIIAKILGLDEIPVRVMTRHTQWQKIRETCHEQLQTDGKLSDELVRFRGHPDLVDLLEEHPTGSFS